MKDLAQELLKIRKSLGLNQTEMAKKFNLAQRTWSSYETGRSDPPMEVLFKLADEGFTIDGLSKGVVSEMKEQGIVSDSDINERLAQAAAFPKDMNAKDLPPLTKITEHGGFAIPILDQSLSAGRGQPLPDSDVPIGYIAVPDELRRYGNRLAALYVNGDSMEPTFRKGELAILDTCGWDGEGIYAIRFENYVYIKRIAHKPNSYVIISDNQKYESWEISADMSGIDIIGRVHYALKSIE